MADYKPTALWRLTDTQLEQAEGRLVALYLRTYGHLEQIQDWLDEVRDERRLRKARVFRSEERKDE